MTRSPAADGRRISLRTTSPASTQEVAATLARTFHPGDVVALTGELGAGKTCFVQGAARELGVSQRVVSPTFVIVREYDARLPADDSDVALVHVDVYRLEHLQEVIELGEDVIMSGDQVTFIEWGDTVERLLPPDRLDVELRLAPDDGDARDITLVGQGRWAAQIVDLLPQLVTWLEGGPAPTGGRDGR